MQDSNPYEAPQADWPHGVHSDGPSSLWVHRALMAGSLAFGFAVGFGMWALSPILFGHREPWDGDIRLYWAILLVSSFVCAIVCPRPWWIAVVGSYLGQVVYLEMLFRMSQGIGPLILPSLVVVALFGILPAIPGAAVGALLGRMLPWGRQRIKNAIGD